MGTYKQDSVRLLDELNGKYRLTVPPGLDALPAPADVINGSEEAESDRLVYEELRAAGESDDSITERLRWTASKLRKEIERETRLKQGAERLRQASIDDRHTQSQVNALLKQSNYKLNELQRDLQEVDTHILLSQGLPTASFPGKLAPLRLHVFPLTSD
jgi:hypothetical protein